MSRLAPPRTVTATWLQPRVCLPSSRRSMQPQCWTQPFAPSSGQWLLESTLSGFPPTSFLSCVLRRRPYISLTLNAAGPRGSVLAPLRCLSVSTPRWSQQVPRNCYRLKLVRLPPRLCPKRWHSGQCILVNIWVRSCHSFAQMAPTALSSTSEEKLKSC